MNAPPADSPLQALLERQRQAFARDINPDWAVRDARLGRLECMLERHAEQFAALIAEDFGVRSSMVTTLSEMLLLRKAIRHARRHLKKWMAPVRTRTSLIFWPGRGQLWRQPLGVVGIIGPWNYPLQLLLSPLISVLAAGNRALLKPSELTPLFAEGLRAAFAEFFEPDEVAVVIGDARVGVAFAALPFDHLVFTGSTQIGRRVAQAAASNLTPVTLELGGKSPAIVDISADLGLAAERIVWGKLLNSGQSCIAPDYVLVPASQMEAFAERIQQVIRKRYPSYSGNPDYTSIINEGHCSRLRALLEDARAQGAQILHLQPESSAAATDSRQMAPVLLLHVTDAMAIMQEEIFGPLLPFVAYDTLDQALQYVNQRPRPLALYWFGRDDKHRARVLRETLSGGVVINDTMLHLAQDNLPFGGVGPSGHGHYHGEFGFRQFSKEKGVFIQSRFSTMPLFYPPYTALGRRLLEVLTRWG